jgi:ribosomal protein S18 acetylase RimI-like enzyme
MKLTFRKAGSEDVDAAVELLADTMADFGVMTMGLGSRELELKALRHWFVKTGNRFSHEFCTLALVDGTTAGLLLTLRGDHLEHLERTLVDGVLKVYKPIQLIRMLWRLMILGRTEEANRDEYLVSHVAVDLEFRRRGIASALLQRAEEEAKQQVFNKLVLEVETDNSGAIRTYEKFGFSTVLTTLFKRRERILGCPGYHKMLKQL